MSTTAVAASTGFAVVLLGPDNSSELSEFGAEGLEFPEVGFIATRVSGKFSWGFVVGGVSEFALGSSNVGLAWTILLPDEDKSSVAAAGIPPSEIESLRGWFDGVSLRSWLATEFVDGICVDVPKLPNSRGLSSDFFWSANDCNCGVGSDGNGSTFVAVVGEFEGVVFERVGVVVEFDSVFNPVWIDAGADAIVAFDPFFGLCEFRITSRQSAITNSPTTTLKERLLWAVAVFGVGMGMETGCAVGVSGAGIGVDSILALELVAGLLDVPAEFFDELAIPPTMFG